MSSSASDHRHHVFQFHFYLQKYWTQKRMDEEEKEAEEIKVEMRWDGKAPAFIKLERAFI